VVHIRITRWLSATINTDEIHGYLFRLLSGHLQAIKIYNIKITMASSVVEGQIEICIAYWRVYCNTKGSNLNLTIQT